MKDPKPFVRSRINISFALTEKKPAREIVSEEDQLCLVVRLKAFKLKRGLMTATQVQFMVRDPEEDQPKDVLYNI